jgi:hypothetical protein
MNDRTPRRTLAVDCRYLRRTIDSTRADGPVVCLCEHPVRSGFDCIGPFIEDLPTDCGLWESKTEAAGLVAGAGAAPASAS